MHIFKKRQNKKWLWIIYNRKKDKVIDFEIGGRGYKTAKKLFDRNNHKYYHTDNYPVYTKAILKEKHTTGKQFTQGIENLNGRIRHYLARFHRKTYCYNKSIEVMIASLYLLFNKEMLSIIFC